MSAPPAIGAAGKLGSFAALAVSMACSSAAVASEPLPVEAVNEGIYGHRWSNAAQTVIGGATIKFSNPYTGLPYHGLKFTSGPTTPSCTGIPAAAGEESGAPNWHGECTFATPGTYTFVCTVHPLEMKGTITVTNGEPSVTTEPAGAIGEDEATLHGTVNPNGKATQYRFQWGTSPSYGNETSVSSAGEGTAGVAVSAVLTGLTPGTPYHYRLLAENEKGLGEGVDRTFTTFSPPGPPTALTGSATAIGESGATLTGSVNPNGQASQYFFEWGPTNTYGQTTALTSVGFEDRAAHSVSAALTGLPAGTTYHYRLIAKNASGEVPGSDREFATAAPPPPPKEEPLPAPAPSPTPAPTNPPPSVPLVVQPASEQGLSFGPALIPGSLKLRGHGASVRGSVGIGLAGAAGRLEIDLLAKASALGRGSKPVVVGRFVRASVSAGTLSFSIRLPARVGAALRRHRRLALTVKITLTPAQGAAVAIARSVTVRA